MSGWLKLGIPIGLGALAFFLNWMAGMSSVAPRYFVRVSEDMRPGEKFTEDNLSKLELRGVSETLKATAISWGNRSVLFNRECGREMKKGDIVFWRDATPPPEKLALQEGEVAFHLNLTGISSSLPRLIKVGDEIGFYLAPKNPKAPSAGNKSAAKNGAETTIEFEYVGPFRVLSIGKKISEDELEEIKLGGGGHEEEITLAVKQQGDTKKLDAKTTRLLEARLASQFGKSGIVAVVLHSAKEYGKPKTTTSQE